MNDPRITKLADLLVNYSTEIKPKQRVLIVLFGMEGLPLLKEVYKKCVQNGAYPRYEIREDEFSRIFFENANKDQISKEVEPYAYDEAKNTDALIQIICERNSSELINVDQQKVIARRKKGKKLSDLYHDKKWVLFEYPTAMGAYNAKMSLKDWEDFVFDACLTDWAKIQKEQEVLEKLINQTDEVKILAEKTDLTVDISGQGTKSCFGKCNMPDGEVFTSPKKTGVNGHITFNTKTSYMNRDFNWIYLEFKDGKVVAEDSDNKTALTEILNTDEGARYVGEFAFGCNRNIQEPVKSILFDEKIGGSNHMALGQCYKDDAPNGNDSNIHWDMILRHKQANGKVYFDGELVQENGLWVHPELKKFNP